MSFEGSDVEDRGVLVVLVALEVLVLLRLQVPLAPLELLVLLSTSTDFLG
jgi:hypothetical protein